MTPSTGSLTDRLRARLQDVIHDYEAALPVELPELDALSRAARIDHLPEVLQSLASWVDAHLAGREHADPFALLAEGHALQRLGFGVSLETVTAEYSLLRRLVFGILLDQPLPDDGRRELLALDRAIDRAVMESMRRYAGQRDLVRERFIGILGHDLRGPLGAISAGADLLLLDGGSATPQQARVAARIANSVRRMTRMIDDVLDFARGHLGGGIPATPTRNDLGQLCRDTVDELATVYPLRAIQLELAGDLRGTWDGERLRQALGNLLGNAITHGADPIVVRAWEGEERESVFASVTNHGHAIPAELLPHLFDPFRRGKTGGSSSVGLGLYIVQQVALAHGGRCTIASDERETVATLHFPRVPVDDMPDRP